MKSYPAPTTMAVLVLLFPGYAHPQQELAPQGPTQAVSSQASAQSTSWEKLNAAATQAYLEGRYDEAEKLCSAALDEAEKFGPQDLRLGTSLNTLADLYYDQRKYGEAEPLYRRALAIREKALGPDHPDLVAILNNLAEICSTQAKYGYLDPIGRELKYDKAKLFFDRSLAILAKALGPEHPRVATTLEKYAVLLRSYARWNRKALARYHKSGDVTRARWSLEDAEKHEAEAAKMEARAKAIRTKSKKPSWVFPPVETP